MSTKWIFVSYWMRKKVSYKEILYFFSCNKDAILHAILPGGCSHTLWYVMLRPTGSYFFERFPRQGSDFSHFPGIVPYFRVCFYVAVVVISQFHSQMMHYINEFDFFYHHDKNNIKKSYEIALSSYKMLLVFRICLTSGYVLERKSPYRHITTGSFWNFAGGACR